MQIPQKESQSNRQPPRRRQQQRQHDSTPAPRLYGPDGGVEGIVEAEGIRHIDLVG